MIFCKGRGMIERLEGYEKGAVFGLGVWHFHKKVEQPPEGNKSLCGRAWYSSKWWTGDTLGYRPSRSCQKIAERMIKEGEKS
jgi:hypothetical protein